MEFTEIKTTPALTDCYPIMRELRQTLTLDNFIKGYQAAHESSDYRLLGVFEEQRCVALMGYRILHDFVHGRHLYVDDLVVTETRRSSGLGAILLTRAEHLAGEHGCQGLRLCTGIDAKGPQRFYERNGWKARAVAFKKTI